ncbi:MAG: flagellar hook-associated protein FlgK [Spirochaetaceae bacterium]|nr:MAG: flagellar hook-associated protein FlgK [Spirochaetaceae bacterium]
MQSTFSGIELGKRSLFAHQIALNTAGHNLSNASTEGFSRQRVEMRAFHAIDRPQLNRAERPGQIGQGVEVARIERVRDRLLEGRIIAQSHSEGYWQMRDKYLMMLEQVYNEPTDLSVRNLMDQFWDSWQELSIFPDQMAARRSVAERGEALMEGVQLRYHSLDRIRTMLNDEVVAAVGQVNEIIREIAELNNEIVKVEAVGDQPNDLYDRRDLLVNRLSGIVNITIDDRNPVEFSIYTSGYHIVQGRIARPFEAVPSPENDGYSNVVWSHSQEIADFRGGSLASALEMRDVDVRREIQKLDNMAINFVDLVNEVHRDGYGLTGETGLDFFVERPAVLNALGNYDRSGDGVFDSTFVFRLTGANELQAQAQIGLSGTLSLSGPNGNVTVNYSPTDTVHDLIARINNSGSEVVARLNREGFLSLKATPAATMENPDFVIRHVEDSGQFLVGYAGVLTASGAAGAYTWDQANAVDLLREDARFSVAPLQNPSAWMTLNSAIVNEPARIAAGFGIAGSPAAIGDGNAALEIAGLRNRPVMVGQVSTFDDYFADSVAEIGLKGEQAELALMTQTTIMRDLRDRREAISGVNIDEELAQMIKFQHGYNAAARFITMVDRMLDTIINRLGV